MVIKIITSQAISQIKAIISLSNHMLKISINKGNKIIIQTKIRIIPIKTSWLLRNKEIIQNKLFVNKKMK